MKKIFTLLTLLLCAVTSSWADDYTQILLYDASSSSITTTPSGDYVTLTGVSQGSGASKRGIQFTDAIATDKYISVTLPSSKTLAAGDKIIITHYQSGSASSPNNNYGTCISATTSTTIAAGCTFGIPNSQGKDAASVTYTVTASDEFVGESTFYVRGFSPSSSKSSFVQKIEVQKPSDTRPSLTLSFTPDNQSIGAGGTLSTSFSILTDISSESTKYSSVTYSSTDEAIATVNSSGVVTGVAEGTTTIKATVTAEADATYKTTTASITVNVIPSQTKDPNMVTPPSTLDLTDASAASALLNGTWHEKYGHPLFGNDGSNNYMVYPLVAAYSSAGTTEGQTWIGSYSLGSSSDSWDATGVFKGSAAYNMTEVKRANLTSGSVLSFRVKGVNKAQILADTRGSSRKVYMSAYEVDAGTPASTTFVYESFSTSSGTNETLTLNLDAEKEYVIALTSTGGDVRLFEMALFYDESVGLQNVPVGATGWSTYSTDKALDFTGLEIEAYQVTGANVAGTAVVKEKITGTVAANTGLLVKGTAGKSYVVPVVASGTDYSATNKMKPNVTASTISEGTGDNVNYVLMNNGGTAEFQWIGSEYSANLGANKAYLTLANGPKPGSGSRSLSIDGDVTAIKNVKVGTEDNVYYDLQGRRVLYPTKGLYIVNGKKVILK